MNCVRSVIDHVFSVYDHDGHLWLNFGDQQSEGHYFEACPHDDAQIAFTQQLNLIEEVAWKGLPEENHIRLN